MLSERVPEISEARNVLEVLSLDKEARLIYQARQKALKDKTSALENAEHRGKEEGIKEGIREKAIETAKKMLKKNYSIDEIIDLTELTKEEIEKPKR